MVPSHADMHGHGCGIRYGMVNQRLLLQTSTCRGEQILWAHLPKRLRLFDSERSTLAKSPGDWDVAPLQQLRA